MIFELEQFLRDDHFAFHADDFGDVRDTAGAVAQTLDLNDQVYRIGDLAGNGFLWDLDVAHQDHVFHTAQALAGAVGVERTHGAIMAGVQCGQQIKALRAADFAKDDTIRTHTQGVLDEVANGDLRSEEHTSELQSLIRNSYAVFCLKK